MFFFVSLKYLIYNKYLCFPCSWRGSSEHVNASISCGSNVWRT